MKSTDELKHSIQEKLCKLYGNETGTKYYTIFYELWRSFDFKHDPKRVEFSEKDSILITYADSVKESGQKPVKALNKFLNKYLKRKINQVHLLPFFPYSSDYGFSVKDYYEIDPELGDWKGIKELGKDFGLMYDFVANHISSESKWFKKFLAGDPHFTDFFIQQEPSDKLSNVIRPRAKPLLTEVETEEGHKHVWTTFSEDQVDLNYDNPEVLLEMTRVLLFYVSQGAKLIRLDAIGFLWKEVGTSCIHLPETHLVIQLWRDILDIVAPYVALVSETNVPHEENLTYLHDGYDEAQMVYQFSLPPLALYSILNSDIKPLTKWLQKIKPITKQAGYFNFLASHDGIGLRGATGYLSDEQVENLSQKVKEKNGLVTYRATEKGPKPYELNINYYSALEDVKDEQVSINRFVLAHVLMLSITGVPGIYIHSILGSKNYLKGVKDTGINRAINREQLTLKKVESDLEDYLSRPARIFTKLTKLIELRSRISAFNPYSAQTSFEVVDSVLAIVRENKETGQRVVSLMNFSDQKVSVNLSLITEKVNFQAGSYTDLEDHSVKEGSLEIPAYGYSWLEIG
jgi:glycosidase